MPLSVSAVVLTERQRRDYPIRPLRVYFVKCGQFMQGAPTQNELITKKQASELLGVHLNTINNLIVQKKLPAVRLGSRIIRIHKQDLLNLLTPFEGGEFGVWSNR